MFIAITLIVGLVGGFMIGFWLSLGEIKLLEERLHQERGRALARDLEPTIERLEQGGDWLWPFK